MVIDMPLRGGAASNDSGWNDVGSPHIGPLFIYEMLGLDGVRSCFETGLGVL